MGPHSLACFPSTTTLNNGHGKPYVNSFLDLTYPVLSGLFCSETLFRDIPNTAH